MQKNEFSFSLKKDLVKELPLTYLFPVFDIVDQIPQISPSVSSFYQTKASICFRSEKPVSKIIPLNEKIF